MKEKKVVFITGASSGVGKATAELLASKGYTVYGTSRKASLPPEGKASPLLLKMDVEDDASIKSAVDYILAKEGKIDVLINNAGFGLAGSVEDTSYNEALKQFETNFFGVHRLIKEVLPSMRERKDGLIINISSIAGIIGLPFQPFYSASKFAVEGLSEALWHEVRPYGVKVVLVEPGDLKTEFTDKRVYAAKSTKSPYTEQMKKSLSVAINDEISGESPEKVARIIYKIINTKNPRFRYQVGPFHEKLAVKLKKILPEKIYLLAVAKYYKIGL